MFELRKTQASSHDLPRRFEDLLEEGELFVLLEERTQGPSLKSKKESEEIETDHKRDEVEAPT